MVAEVSPHRMVEMFEVMGELEAMCGRLAARRMLPPEHERLLAAHRACEAAREANDPDAYYYENERFHHLDLRREPQQLPRAAGLGAPSAAAALSAVAAARARPHADLAARARRGGAGGPRRRRRADRPAPARPRRRPGPALCGPGLVARGTAERDVVLAAPNGPPGPRPEAAARTKRVEGGLCCTTAQAACIQNCMLHIQRR